MLLCDIGNTSFHFLDKESDFKESVETFNPYTITKKVYYISVNSKVNKKLQYLQNWINLYDFIDIDAYYDTMGIDRIMACEAVENAVIVDVGSAITVDVVQDGNFMGGFIYPGINAMQKAYTNISCTLDYSFNFECDLDIMPKNSQDAISYGYLKTLLTEIVSHNLPIILTGGDAKRFKKIFKDAKIDEKLIFTGIKKIMKKANIC